MQDNAPLHTAHKILLKIRDTGFNAVDQPSYSPDLPTSGYYLLPQQEKKNLTGTNYHLDAEKIVATEGCLEAQTSEFFLQSFKKMKDYCNKCADMRGEYVE